MEIKLGKTTVRFDSTETRGVLGGVYRGSDKRNLLTHLVFVLDGGDVRTGCRQPVENMADSFSASASDRAARPTCPTCAKKWDKLNG